MNDNSHINMKPTSTMHRIPASPTSRRQFLSQAVALTAGATGLTALGLAGCAAPGQSSPRKIVVGGHPWVYAATQPGYDITPVLPQIFADMKYAGLDAVELMSTALRPDDAVERIGQLSRQHQLPVLGASFSGAMWDRQQHATVLDDAALVIPRLAQLGGRTLGISVGPPKGGSKVRKTPEQLDAQAELLRKIFALCDRHRVVPNLHNHTYEVENDLHDLKGTLARLPGTRLGPDLNWLVRGGVDPVAFLRQYRGQIVFLHLRDQKKDGRWSEALGEGDMDYTAIGVALREIHFQGDAVIELAHERDFKPTRPLRESLKLSREFVRLKLGC
jgi:sugar phosphate isomerase/epimerase